MYLAPDNNNKPNSTVREIQYMLNRIRTNYHHNWQYLSEDGIYGKKSAEVVKAFQDYRGITTSFSPNGVFLGDTTIEYIRQEYETIPVLRSSQSKGQILTTKTNNGSKISHAAFDLLTLLTNEGAPIYKKLEEAFPLAFKRLSAKSDKPLFVFSKQMAYHNGAKYKRFNLPENVSKYLGFIGLAWSWVTIWEDVNEYNRKRKSETTTVLDLGKLSGQIYSLCTSSIDAILSLPATKQLAQRIAGRYAVAETGAAFSLAGASALSTIGSCIGAFLLGWEIGDLIGDIPIGDGRHVQDIIDDYIDMVWEHPYKTLGPSQLPIALAIDNWKRLIDLQVNMVSNLKPLTPAEKRKLDLYLLQNKELAFCAAPPIYVITSRK